MEVGEGGPDDGVGAVVGGGDPGRGHGGKVVPCQGIEDKPGDGDQTDLDDDQGDRLGVQGVDGQPQQQGGGEVLSQAAVEHVCRLTVLFDGAGQGGGEGTFEPAPMEVIPKNLVENALVVGGVEGEVAVEGEGHGDRPENAGDDDHPP